MTQDAVDLTRSPLHTPLIIFVAALAIRWGYDGNHFVALGKTGLLGIDSLDYVRDAQEFASAAANGSLHGWQWLGPNPLMMPLFTWLLALHAIAGEATDIAFILTQGVIDALTCVLIYALAARLHPALAAPAGVIAAINPTQIVLAGLVYTDTLFVFFVALFLLGAVIWLKRPGWSAALLIGIGLAGAQSSRVLIAPFAIAMLIFLLISTWMTARLRLQQVMQLVMAGVLFSIPVSLIVGRNLAVYGHATLTSQSGMHLNRWIVPLIKEAQDGTPWRQSYERMERLTAEHYGPPDQNPFEQSARYRAIALEEMSKLSAVSVVKAWAFGAAVNLGAPAIILSPIVSNLPRTGFYGTRGNSLIEKVWTFFFRSDNALYAWVLLVGTLGVFTVRAMQMLGAAELIRQSIPISVLLLFAGWIVFILLVNGPVASPKYRLPIEPVLVLLTAGGWRMLTGWLSRIRRRG